MFLADQVSLFRDGLYLVTGGPSNTFMSDPNSSLKKNLEKVSLLICNEILFQSDVTTTTTTMALTTTTTTTTKLSITPPPPPPPPPPQPTPKESKTPGGSQ